MEMETMGGPNNKRVIFSFSPGAYDELVVLQHNLRVSSKTEAIRLSLSVTEWLVEVLQQDKTILIEEKSGKVSRVRFPFLEVKKN